MHHSHILVLTSLLVLFSGCDSELGMSTLSSDDKTDTPIETNTSTESNVTDTNETETQTPIDTNTSAEIVPTTFSDIEGRVVDGYIRGATVCLDFNQNNICDFNESIIHTDENGTFSFSDTLKYNVNPITVIAFHGVDTATEKDFKGFYRSVIDITTLTQESHNLIISPITDLSTLVYLQNYDHTLENIDLAKEEIAILLNLTKEQTSQDPMKDVKLFCKAQEIEHTKQLLNTVALKHKNISRSMTEEEFKVQEVIKKELLNLSLNIEQIVIAMEIKLDIKIPENEQTFVIAQVTEIKRVLNDVANSTNITNQLLERVQRSLDSVQSAVIAYLAISDEDVILDVVELNITEETITESDYDKVDAIEDPQACITGNGYSKIINNANHESITTDTTNGVSIRSQYPQDEDNSTSEVVFFYPNLTKNKTYEESIIFGDNYYFVYDTSWPQSQLRTVYVQTPSDINNSHTCYRYYLNTNKISDVTPTKVFRYSEI